MDHTQVTLTLWTFDPEGPLFLTIPSAVIARVTLKPVKWLRYVACSILHTEGHVSHTAGGLALDDDNIVVLQPDENFYFVPRPSNAHLDSAVVTKAIQRRGTPSATSEDPDKDFRARLLQRDGRCVFSGALQDICDESHLIPHAHASQYLSLIMNPRGDDFKDVDVLENGITMVMHGNRLLDQRKIAILKTPNHTLTMEDVPREPNPVPLRAGCQPLPDARYTLQYIGTTRVDDEMGALVANRDTQFQQVVGLPSEHVLDYVYGASILQLYQGGALTAFKNRPDRPKRPTPKPRGRASRNDPRGYAPVDAFDLCLAFRLVSAEYARQRDEENRQLYSDDILTTSTPAMTANLDTAPTSYLSTPDGSASSPPRSAPTKDHALP